MRTSPHLSLNIVSPSPFRMPFPSYLLLETGRLCLQNIYVEALTPKVWDLEVRVWEVTRVNEVSRARAHDGIRG